MLLSCSGLMKLCDFGFARVAGRGEALSEYVATRYAAAAHRPPPPSRAGALCPQSTPAAAGTPAGPDNGWVAGQVVPRPGAAGGRPPLRARRRHLGAGCALAWSPAQPQAASCLRPVRQLCPGSKSIRVVTSQAARLPAAAERARRGGPGCMLVEMHTGAPLFPGDSDVDQLWLILKCLGRLAPQHAAAMAVHPSFEARALTWSPCSHARAATCQRQAGRSQSCPHGWQLSLCIVSASAHGLHAPRLRAGLGGARTHGAADQADAQRGQVRTGRNMAHKALHVADLGRSVAGRAHAGRARAGAAGSALPEVRPAAAAVPEGAPPRAAKAPPHTRAGGCASDRQPWLCAPAQPCRRASAQRSS